MFREPSGRWLITRNLAPPQAAVWRMGCAPRKPTGLRKATAQLLKLLRNVLPFTYYVDPPAPFTLDAGGYK